MDSPKTPERSELRRSPSRPYQRRQREAPQDLPAEPAAEPAVAKAPEPAAVAKAPEPAAAKAPARARRRTAAPGPEAAVPIETTPAKAIETTPAKAIETTPAVPVETAAAPPAPTTEPLAAAPALVETWLPGPRELPTALASSPAPAPGLAPRGDSRSLRNGERFALVYRVLCSVITRTGQVGELGTFRCVDYPTPAAASNAYARCCSSWVSEGFSDYRG